MYKRSAICALLIAITSVGAGTTSVLGVVRQAEAPNREASAKLLAERLRAVELTGQDLAQQWPVGLSTSKLKKEVLACGAQAIPPLMSLLSEMLDRQRHAAEQIGQGHTDSEQAPMWVVEDCCELLGRLRAVEGVPLILQVIEDKDYFTMVPKIDVPVLALTRIGKPAIPAITAELGVVFEKITLRYESFARSSLRGDLVRRGVNYRLAGHRFRCARHWRP